jgi:hypothetical protein
MTRRTRFLAAGFALIAMLSAQLALASYACPFGVAEITAPVHGGCSGMAMDQEQPMLCHAHGQQGDQSLDKPLVSVPGMALASGFAIAHAPDPGALGPPGDQRSLLARATAPSVALRHCCLRI